MDPKFKVQLAASLCLLLLLWPHSRPQQALGSPLEPAPLPLIAIPSMYPAPTYQAPLMFAGSHYADPYAFNPYQAQQYFMAPHPFNLAMFEQADRRSNGPIGPSRSAEKSSRSSGESDEQKALGDLPLSFVSSSPEIERRRRRPD